MKSIQSQLAGKTVNNVAPRAPESQFGQFVLGDMKGGSAAHEFRMSMVTAAVREALKGNSRALIEATAIATGKSKKALSYFDGFKAIGIPARIVYTGKLSDPANKEVVERIDADAARLSTEFELAFLARFHAPAEPKAKTKGKVQGTAPVAEAGDDANAGAPEVAAATLDIGDLMRAATTAILAGSVQPSEVDALRAAIAAYDAATVAAIAATTATAEAVPA